MKFVHSIEDTYSTLLTQDAKDLCIHIGKQNGHSPCPPRDDILGGRKINKQCRDLPGGLWLSICLPLEGIQVRSLPRATKLMLTTNESAC